jgi:hypothetical protein
MSHLFMRAPFEAVVGSQSTDYIVTMNATGHVHQTVVTVDAGNPARLNLQPLFPGRLTFKPDPSALIPANPSLPDTPAIKGNLYLELCERCIHELARAIPSIQYRLVFGYLGIALGSRFFTETVLRSLKKKSGSGFLPKRVKGKKLTTAAEISNSFARGELSVDIRPTKTSAVYTFPGLTPDSSNSLGTATFVLGLQTSDDPFHLPPSLADSETVDFTSGQDFFTVPLAYLFHHLRLRPDWSALAADGHANHAFFQALDEANEVSAPGRWRRVRVFLPGNRPGTSTTAKTFGDLRVIGRSAVGTEIWHSNLNQLGDVFVRRPTESFRLQIQGPSGIVPISFDPADSGELELDVTWPISPSNGTETIIDITAHVKVEGDPLTINPLVPLQIGAVDQKGLTLHRPGKRILAEKELIKPLQATLTAFGFQTPINGTFTRRTQRDVRAFQTQAQTTARLGSAGPIDPATVVAWAGTANGIADENTLAEMLVWRTKGYRSAVSDELWPDANRWTDAIPGTSTTFIENYHAWVVANFQRFNEIECLCNWFPLLLLVEYAAAHGLHLRLRYYPGVASTAEGGERRWDFTRVLIHDSHNGAFNTKSSFYRKVKSTVTARMIGELNSKPIAKADVIVGDLLIYDFDNPNSSYWHAEVVTNVSPTTVDTQSGSTPKVRPADHTSSHDDVPDNAYQETFRRWDFAQFD